MQKSLKREVEWINIVLCSSQDHFTDTVRVVGTGLPGEKHLLSESELASFSH